ncbi:non-ribosomal peptide synthetase, partial [Streptomyces sp. UNOC14_S4]|uniref:non-ribosomal peptide synthetase n=1 Tax=Streptomyces sp. UNOC14_S4 TaxID=2872340 RepID=UPI001E3DEE39
GGPGAAADLAHWRTALGGDLPVLALPADRPRPALMTSNGRAVFHTLDAGLSARLRELSRGRRATLFMTLLAGYAAMLHRVTGQDDLVIGTPMSNRPQDAGDLLGFFVNTLALRLDVSGDPDFGTLLDRVRAVALDAYDHADVPFEAVVRELAPPRATDRTPVFQTLAEFERGEPFRFDLPGVRATPLDAGPDKALTDLAVYFTDQPEGIRCHLEYNTDLFDAETVDGFFATFRALLEAAVETPATPLSRLAAAAMAAAPGAPVPASWERGPDRPVHGTTVHGLVAQRAAEGPDRTAVVCGDTVLTYRQLDERADRLAAALLERTGPAGPDGTVALWLPRTPDLVVAMLAVLKSGHAYLPLDPALGRARAEAVIAECGARAVIGTPESTAALRLPSGVAVVTPGDTPSGTVDTSRAAVGRDSLCYVVHTSGSTGTPKGVAVSHHAVLDLCQWHHRRFGFTPADRAAAVCGLGFDASVMEFWPALTAGASVAVADDDAVRKDPLALARWYRTRNVTFTVLPTALGETVLELPAEEQPPLRHLLLGGDALRTRPRPGVPYETVNVYGPTETTVLCTTETVTPDGHGEITIGRPVDNVRLRVLDAAGQPVPVGTVGELHVGGPGVARGYLGRPEATDERFRTDPVAGRVYRTGDLVRWTEDGRLEFRGRTDDQVKIRGYRVEPEEPARALAALDGVREAAVLARRDARGEAYLAAFAVPADPVGGTSAYGSSDTAADRQAFADLMADELAARLPEYLVPRAWAVLGSLPYTANGKLDRAALPATDLVTGAGGGRASDAGDAGDRGPASDTERRLRELWADQLGRLVTDPGQLRPDTSFFDLGGHSIAAIRLLNRVRAEFATDYPMARFYQEPTLRAMIAVLGGSPDDEVEERAPVTVQQDRFLTAHAQHALPQVFNVALRVTLTGALDVPALRTALTRLVARHAGLRTRFAGDDGERVQEVLRPAPVELPVEDLTAYAPEARAAEAERISALAANTCFDPAVGVAPLFRLLRTGEAAWELLWVLHHSVCDGWAVSLLLKEFAALYTAAVTGAPDGLPAEPPRPTEYARWQRDRARETDTATRAGYWLRELDGAPLAHGLPLDRPRPETLSGRGRVVTFTVPAEVRADTDRLAARRGTTPFAVTAAVAALLFAREAGRDEVVLNVPYANRERHEHEQLVACTAQAFPLRVRTGGALTAVVDAVAQAAARAVDHLLPYPEIVSAARERQGVDLPPRLALGFVYQNSLETDITLPGVTAAVTDLAPNGSRTEVSFGLVPAGDAFTGFVEYTEDLWERATVERWGRDYAELLAEEVRKALRD